MRCRCASLKSALCAAFLGSDPCAIRYKLTAALPPLCTHAEWHAYSMHRYWTTLWPREQQLRERHLANGGKYLSLVLLREPMQHIVSTFLMWPLNGLKGNQLGIKPFESYLEHEASGLQTRELTMGLQQASACDTELAMDRLLSFDLVCSLRLLSTCLEVVASEFALSARRSGEPRATPSSLIVGGAMWNASHEEVRIKTRSVVTYEQMRRAAACDQSLMDREHEWMGPVRALVRGQRDRGVAFRSASLARGARPSLNASRG